MNKQYDYALEFKVRDYECDMAGIVNNSVYLNYLEHARHEFIQSVGLDFSEMLRAGIVAVVVRADLSYKTPLRSGDSFSVNLRVEHEGLKYIFYQDIYRLSDRKLCLKAVITATTLVDGKLAVSEAVVRAIERTVEKRGGG